jgi:hypothetical protein
MSHAQDETDQGDPVEAGHGFRLQGHRIGKLGTAMEVQILGKVNKAALQLDSLTTVSSSHVLYYQEACR